MYTNLPDREIIIGSRDILVTKTDHAGVIDYGNESFIEKSGYSKEEIIGQNHNLIRHPDMPKVIFYLMWKSIKKRKNFTAILKNLAKNGSYYWVVTDFKTKEDYSGAIESHIAYRRAVAKSALEIIEPLYNTLLRIENDHGLTASLQYLNRYILERNGDYDTFIDNILEEIPLSQIISNKLKTIFS